jgi:hypothetical protein
MSGFALMSDWFHLGGLAIEEGANPKLGLLVALRHRRHQRLHQKAGLRIGLGDHRQRLQHREIRQRRVFGDLGSELHRFGKCVAFLGQILRKAVGRTLGRGINSPGQHHVCHPGDADQPWQPHRSATADENAALAFGQREIRRRLGDADMRRTGKFQPAADDRAAQRGDHGHAAILNTVEHPVPHLRMPQAFGRIVLGQFRQIEAGGEMVANAVDDNRADSIREIREAILDRENNAVVQRIALGRAVEAHSQHRA